MIMTTTNATAAAIQSGLASGLAVPAILTLILLLIAREITHGIPEPWAERLGKALSVTIVPLIWVFAFTFVFSIYEVLN